MRGFVVRYILQTTGAFVQGPGNLNPAPTPTLKLATQEPLSVTYLNAAGQPVLLTGDYLPYLGMKVAGHYDAPFVALSTILAAPAAGSFAYVGVIPCNTTEFYAALGDTAGAAGAESDTVALMGELVVQVDADGNLARSQTFSITGQNRVVTGSEGVPVSANPAYPSAAAVNAAVALGMFPGLTNMILVGYQFGNVFFTQVNSGLADEGQDTQATFVAGGSVATLCHARYSYAFDTLAGAPAIIDGTALTGELGPTIYLDYVPSLQVRNFANATGISFLRQSTSSLINSVSISGCPQVSTVFASNAFGNSAAVGVCIQAVAAFAQATHAANSAQGTNGNLDVTNNPAIPTDAATTAALATLSSLGWSVASGQAG